AVHLHCCLMRRRPGARPRATRRRRELQSTGCGPGSLRVMSVVVVLAGGPERPAAVALPPGATVIAADSGAELALQVDLAVGDFDSISAEALARVGRVERHPEAKDASDLELA